MITMPDTRESSKDISQPEQKNTDDRRTILEDMLKSRLGILPDVKHEKEEKTLGVASGFTLNQADNSNKLYVKILQEEGKNSLQEQAVRDYLFGNLEYFIAQKKLPQNVLMKYEGQHYLASKQIDGFINAYHDDANMKNVQGLSDLFALNYMICNQDIFNPGNIGQKERIIEKDGKNVTVTVAASLDYGLAGSHIELNNYISDMSRFCAGEESQAIDATIPTAQEFVESLSNLVDNSFFQKDGNGLNIYQLIDSNHHQMMRTLNAPSEEIKKQLNDISQNIKSNIEKAFSEAAELVSKTKNYQIPLENVSLEALYPIIDMFEYNQSKKLEPGSLKDLGKELAQISHFMYEIGSDINVDNFTAFLKAAKKHQVDLYKLGTSDFTAGTTMMAICKSKDTIDSEALDDLFGELKPKFQELEAAEMSPKKSGPIFDQIFNILEKWHKNLSSSKNNRTEVQKPLIKNPLVQASLDQISQEFHQANSSITPKNSRDSGVNTITRSNSPTTRSNSPLGFGG